ncbi:MAG TPA: SDR family NAD(P)-dependent oxidoreductase [Polyangia bacterium]|nr:SDR family NAD(P)-dependent oxidoreductase [Polyangia bacterium]
MNAANVVNVAILGATRGMGRALARRLAARGDRLFLLGRDADELEASAQDLRARSGRADAVAGVAACDLEKPESFAPALDAAEAALGKLDTVVVTAGLFATQDRLEADLDFTRRLLAADFTNTVVFCEEARRRLLAPRDGKIGGTLCVFSSVAGERGRKPVILYGAAKAGLTRYLEGLDHKFRAQGLRTICVKPGFVKTGMTEGLKPPPFAGEPDAVAALVCRAIDAGKPVVYAPPIWALVMLVIRWLPRFVMRKIGF